MSVIREAMAHASSLSRFMRIGVHNNWKYVKSTATELQKFSRISVSCNNPILINEKPIYKIALTEIQCQTPNPRNSIRNIERNKQLDLVCEHFRPQVKIELPVASIIENFKVPPLRDIGEINNEPVPYSPIKAPPSGHSIEQQAARLIVIRRRKMKKHKLRKLRIKMKFEWAKVRQRREYRKEKAFQAGLIAQIKEAEKFDAEKYVAERLQKANKLSLSKT